MQTNEVKELKKTLARQEEKLDIALKDLHRIKQFFLWSFIATIVTFVLPMIGAVILIPMMLGSYLDSFKGLL